MDNEKSAPEQVGAMLKTARMTRAESLQSVAQRTRIPKRFLEALENGHPEELPAPVYLRSFLQDYCEYLEIDFEPLWSRLKPPAPPPSPESPAAEPEPDVPEPESVSWKESPYLKAVASSSWSLLAALALAAALILWVSRHEKSANPSEDFHPTALRPARAAVEPTLAVTFRDDAWVRLKADGVTVFEGQAPKNARQQWRARKTFALRTDAPASLQLSLNGAPISLPQPEADGSYLIGSP